MSKEEDKEDLKNQLKTLMDRIDKLDSEPEKKQGETQIQVERQPVPQQPNVYEKNGVQMEEIPEQRPAPPLTPSQQAPKTQDNMEQFFQKQETPPPQPQQSDAMAQFFQKQQPVAPAHVNQQTIQQMQMNQQTTIDKRVAAGELLAWLGRARMLGLIAFVGPFIMYMFVVAGIGLAFDITFFGLLIGIGYFLFRIQRHIAYLQQKYNFKVGRQISLPGMKQQNQAPSGFGFQQPAPQQPVQQPGQWPPQQGGNQQW